MEKEGREINLPAPGVEDLFPQTLAGDFLSGKVKVLQLRFNSSYNDFVTKGEGVSRIDEWVAAGISTDGVAALEHSQEGIDQLRNWLHPSMKVVFGLTTDQLQEITNIIGESPVAVHFRELQPKDPQRPLLIKAVTDLINPKIEEDMLDQALQVTERVPQGTFTWD